jgi:hypothetical protein
MGRTPRSECQKFLRGYEVCAVNFGGKCSNIDPIQQPSEERDFLPTNQRDRYERPVFTLTCHFFLNPYSEKIYGFRPTSAIIFSPSSRRPFAFKIGAPWLYVQRSFFSRQWNYLTQFWSPLNTEQFCICNGTRWLAPCQCTRTSRRTINPC